MKFFAKKETETVVTNSSYPQVVQDIHREFECAADNLLKEATEVLKDAQSLDVGKVSRLERLGFGKAKQVTEIKPMIAKKAVSEIQIQMVNYYRKHYPLNKFITEDQVQEICHKYGLVCGDVGLFMGFVPEKNLREIERFKLRSQDNDLVELKNTCGRHVSLGFYKKSALKFDSEVGYLVAGGSVDGAIEPDIQEALISEAQKRGVRRSMVYIQMDASPVSLKICAPVKDMDMSEMTVVEGYKLEKYVPDPVVLQPVDGGYLILTAWGDEASDPIVVNEINN